MSATIKPGYKQTEVGVIPEEWQCHPSSDLTTYFGGNAFKSEAAVCDGVRWLKIANVGKQQAVWDASSFLPHSYATEFKAYLLHEGDVVMALTRPILDNHLKIAKLSSLDVPSLLNQRVAKIVARPGADLNFIYYSLQTRRFVDAMNDAMAGSDPPNIGSKTLGKILIASPNSVPEQRAISEALSDVDGLLGALDRLIAKKRDLKQAVMQQLLTAQTRLPGFSGKWEVKRLKAIVQTPVTDGPHLTPHFFDAGIPFLSVNNLVGNKIDLTDLRFISQQDHEAFSKKCKPRKDDILLGKAASVGKVAIVELDSEFNIWSPIALIRVSDNHAARFVYYQLQSAELISQITLLTNSSSQGNIGMGEIEKLTLKLPPLPEQTAIAEVLSEMDAELAALEQRREKTRALKQGMMQELLTGRTRLVS
jgi:type I restriction enzyme, S subunit